MAKWRALHGAITVSPQVIRMTEFEQLLFTWMIPHADDWGIISGDPLDLKVKVMPASDRPLADFDRALVRMEELGLIRRYEPDGEGPLVQFPSWDELQPIREDRRDDPKHTLYADCPAGARPVPDTSLAIPDQTRPDQTKDKETSLVKHWSVQCYRHVVHKHVKIPLREEWVAFAERNYTDEDEDAKFQALKADIKAYMAKGWYEGNIEWLMGWVESGKPEKWGGKGGTHQQEPQLTADEIAQYFPES